MQGVRRVTENGYTTVWVSANATYRWATGLLGHGRWPCSSLKGRRVRAQFEPNGDLVDLTVDGRDGVDVPSYELDAMLEDLIGTAHPTCEHRNVTPHVSRFAGTFSHHCQDCGMYIIGLEDDEDDE